MEAHTPPPIPTCNLSVVVGELVQLPEPRELPSGSIRASFSLTVRAEGQKTTSVPFTWFDPPKRVFRWKEGDLIIAIGAVVRRFYQAGGSLQSATDVTVQHADLATQSKRSHAVLAKSLPPLEELDEALQPD